MSKRITVRLKARRASDIPSLMKSIANAASDKVDLEMHIEHEPRERNGSSRVRKDEQLETLVNGEASRELDRLNELANAAEAFKRDELRAKEESARQQAERRGGIRSWIGATAKAGWVTVVKVVAERMLKGGGSPSW